ncbi:MAG: PrpF domain-containing protein [Pseudomonadota bacterium]|nr:PrpF domain-containing protein [Pseudomonadota bacterium]
MFNEKVHCLGMAPRFLAGVLEIPVYHMRGGTSTGIVLFKDHLPESQPLREELIRHLMGVPQKGEVHGDRQITGLGRGIPQSCKVFIVGRSDRDDADIDSTLAQLAPGKAAIDWSVNCGNMSSTLPIFAQEIGLIKVQSGRSRVRIYNTNTGVVTHALIDMPEPGQPMATDAEIPGVMGKWPGVQLALLKPAGSKTGALLPTGNAIDVFNGLEVSCVDLAVPMVIASASDFGKTAQEDPAELDADKIFMDKMQDLWVAAGLAMKLKNADGVTLKPEELAVSETIPKACIIGHANTHESDRGASLSVRYFTPQACHKSLAVTGGACLAAGCLIPGTVANKIVHGVKPLTNDNSLHEIKMANPAGILKATIEGSISNDGTINMPSAAYERSTQILLRGHTPIYGASEALNAHYA